MPVVPWDRCTVSEPDILCRTGEEDEEEGVESITIPIVQPKAQQHCRPAEPQGYASSSTFCAQNSEACRYISPQVLQKVKMAFVGQMNPRPR